RRDGECAGTIEVSHRGISSQTVTRDTGDVAARAAAAIAELTGVSEHDVAVVIGSGWAPAAEALGTPTATVDMDDLPGFTPPAAVGHRGKVMSVAVDD